MNCQWYGDDGKPLAEQNKDFPNDQKPGNDISYTLKAWFDAGVPTDESTANSNGNIAGSNKPEAPGEYHVEAQGTYLVYVVTGSVTIKKTIKGTTSDRGRSFVYLVTGTDDDGKIVKQFKDTQELDEWLTRILSAKNQQKTNQRHH